MKKLCCLVVCALTLTGLALADELILHNGAVITGTYVGGDARSVRFLGPEGTVQAYSVSHVSAIRFSTPPTAAAPTVPAPPVAPAVPAPPAPPPASPVAAARLAATSGSAPVTPPTGITVPAGTEIRVRLLDSIDADITGVGERFQAHLDAPIKVGRQIVVPNHTDATVQVMRVEQSGAIKGSDEVALRLYDITLENGRSYRLTTNYPEHRGKGKGRKTVRNAAIGSAVGAVVGGVFGGGKGAAIGAALGGGGGITASTLRGTKLRIPSESRLKFVLRAPLAF